MRDDVMEQIQVDTHSGYFNTQYKAMFFLVLFCVVCASSSSSCIGFLESLTGVLTIYKNHPVGNFRHKH